MDTITPFEWRRLFIGVESPLYFLEITLRVILIYSFAVIVLRLVGKRGRRQMSTFELLLVIALGSATGDAMLYPDVPILYAWLIIFIIVILNRLLSEFQFRYKSVNNFLEDSPRLLVREGKIIEESLHKEQLRRDELMGMLREQEITNTGEIQYVFLEQTGNLGVYRHIKSQKSDAESTYPQDFLE